MIRGCFTLCNGPFKSVYIEKVPDAMRPVRKFKLHPLLSLSPPLTQLYAFFLLPILFSPFLPSFSGPPFVPSRRFPSVSMRVFLFALAHGYSPAGSHGFLFSHDSLTPRSFIIPRVRFVLALYLSAFFQLFPRFFLKQRIISKRSRKEIRKDGTRKMTSRSIYLQRETGRSRVPV